MKTLNKTLTTVSIMSFLFGCAGDPHLASDSVYLGGRGVPNQKASQAKYADEESVNDSSEASLTDPAEKIGGIGSAEEVGKALAELIRRNKKNRTGDEIGRITAGDPSNFDEPIVDYQLTHISTSEEKKLSFSAWNGSAEGTYEDVKLAYKIRFHKPLPLPIPENMKYQVDLNFMWHASGRWDADFLGNEKQGNRITGTYRKVITLDGVNDSAEGEITLQVTNARAEHTMAGISGGKKFRTGPPEFFIELERILPRLEQSR